MRVLYEGKDLEIYAVYWSEHLGVTQRVHVVIMDEGDKSITVVTESECELINSEVSDFIMIKNESGNDALAHAAILFNDLTDRLFEGEPGAMDEFTRRLEFVNANKGIDGLETTTPQYRSGTKSSRGSTSRS